VLGFIISGLTMYAFAKRVFGTGAGVLAAVVYVFVPYRLLDVYVRSAFSEFFAFSFLPLILLLFHDLAERRSWRHLALASLAYAGLFLTHAATALIFTMLLVPYVGFLIFSRLRVGRAECLRATGMCLAAAVVALGLTSIFLLPMLAEKAYIVETQWTQGSFGYAKHFVYLSQLFSPFWGYGYAGEDLQDEMSLQLGMAATTLALVGVICSMLKEGTNKGHVLFFLVASLVTVLAMMPVALPIWQILPLAALVQFPWRLLGLAALTMSFLSGTAFHSFGERPAHVETRLDPRLGVLLLMVVLASYAYTLPEYTAPSPRSEQPVAIIDFESFYPPDRVGMTVWVTEQPHNTPLVERYLSGKPLVKARALAEGATMETIRHGGASEEIRVTSPEGTEVQFYTYYFPGWRGYVNGREVEIYPTGPHGLITLQVPAGGHRVSIRFGDTPVRVLGTALSVFSAALVVAVLIGDVVRGRRLT